MNLSPSTASHRRLAVLTLAFSLLLPVGTLAQDTGWLQTAGGTYDYNDPANWVDGVVNGRWDESLTLASHQIVTFGADTVADHPFVFNYAGNYDVRLRGAGSRTLTLGGDLFINTLSGRDVKFGSAAADETLVVDLGGVTRTVTTTSSRIISFWNPVQNGDLISTGVGTLRMAAHTGGAPDSTITVEPLATLNFYSGDSGFAGTTRAGDVALYSGLLSVNGNGTVNSVDTIAGALAAAAADVSTGYSASRVTVAPNSARNARLEAGSYARPGRGVALFRGTNLGVNSLASQTPNSANIAFTTAPSLIGGGGAAETTTISIVPGALGGTTTSDGGSTFLTYDAVNGLRPLNINTEYATSVASGTTSTDNVRLTGSGSLATVDEATAINSLIIRPSGDSSLDGDGTLTVTSGQVQLNLGNVSSTTRIRAPLNFGSAEGVIVSSSNRLIEIMGGISGSGGLTFYQTPAGNPSIYCSVRSSTGSYTGNTYVLGRLEINSTFLPYGTRTGDVYVHGLMRLNQAGYNGTINGLFGGGRVNYENSGNSSFTIGDNDSDGDFTGTFTFNGSITVIKTGAGTQRLAGNYSQTRGTVINGGTLIVDGSFPSSAVTVNANATLRGSGSISKPTTAITVKSGATLAPGDADGIGTMTVREGDVVFEDGALMEYTIGTAGQGALSVEGSVTGSVEIPITFAGEGSGKWKILEASAIAPTFVSQTAGVKLTLENGGTELWAESLPKGTVIMVR